MRVRVRSTRVQQAFDPDDASTGSAAVGPSSATSTTSARCSAATSAASGGGAGRSRSSPTRASRSAESDAVDLTDPLAAGIFRIDSGREPAADDEVAINSRPGLARLRRSATRSSCATAASFTVVGIGEHGEYLGTARGWSAPRAELETGDYGRPVVADRRWATSPGTRSATSTGSASLVLSRAVMLDPPPDSEIPAEIRSWDTSTDSSTIAVAVLDGHHGAARGGAAGRSGVLPLMTAHSALQKKTGLTVCWWDPTMAG